MRAGGYVGIAEMKEHPDQWTLGQLLDALKSAPADNAVRFNFCSIAPTDLDSYRGYFSELALGWAPQENYPEPLVSMLLERLTKQLGTVVHGWKGGEYTVSREQILYVANPGETGNTCVVGVESTYQTIIVTKHSGT